MGIWVSFGDKTGGDRLALSGNSAGFPVMVNWGKRREIRAFRAVMGLGFVIRGVFDKMRLLRAGVRPSLHLRRSYGCSAKQKVPIAARHAARS